MWYLRIIKIFDDDYRFTFVKDFFSYESFSPKLKDIKDLKYKSIASNINIQKVYFHHHIA